MDSSLLAYQVFWPLQPGDRLHPQLHRAILGVPASMQHAQKQRFYLGIFELLAPVIPHFTAGNWDYTNDDDEAETEYRRWCQGTQDDAHDRPLMGNAAPQAPRYQFLTLLFLLKRGGKSDQRLEQLTAMPPDQLWRRETFVKLLGAIPELHFPSVGSDAIYLCPGNGAPGLTEEELRSPRYQYLHRIV